MNRVKRDYRAAKKDMEVSIRRLGYHNSFEEKKFRHRYADINDSIQMERTCDSLKEVFLLSGKKMLEHVNRLDSMEQVFQERLIKELNYLAMVKGHFSALTSSRLMSFDNFDYPIKQQIKSFNPNDSFLFINGEKLFNVIKGYLRETKTEIRNYKKSFRYYSRALGYLKKMQKSNSTLLEEWETARTEFVSVSNESVKWYDNVEEMLSTAKVNYTMIMKYGRKTMQDIETENQIYKSNSAIRKHIKGLKKVNKNLSGHIRRFNKKNSKEIEELKKAISEF